MAPPLLLPLLLLLLPPPLPSLRPSTQVSTWFGSANPPPSSPPLPTLCCLWLGPTSWAWSATSSPRYHSNNWFDRLTEFAIGMWLFVKSNVEREKKEAYWDCRRCNHLIHLPHITLLPHTLCTQCSHYPESRRKLSSSPAHHWHDQPTDQSRLVTGRHQNGSAFTMLFHNIMHSPPSLRRVGNVPAQ